MEKALEALSFDAWCAPTIFFGTEIDSRFAQRKALLARPIPFNLVQNATQLYDEIRGVREHDEEKLVQLVVLVFRKMGLVDSFKIDPQVPAETTQHEIVESSVLLKADQLCNPIGFRMINQSWWKPTFVTNFCFMRSC